MGIPESVGAPGIDPVKFSGVVNGVGFFVETIFAPGGTHIVHLNSGDESQRFALAACGGSDGFVDGEHQLGVFQTAESDRLGVVLAVHGKFLRPLFFHLLF